MFDPLQQIAARLRQHGFTAAAEAVGNLDFLVDVARVNAAFDLYEKSAGDAFLTLEGHMFIAPRFLRSTPSEF